jgi:hypothetical protein
MLRGNLLKESARGLISGSKGCRFQVSGCRLQVSGYRLPLTLGRGTSVRGPERSRGTGYRKD